MTTEIQLCKDCAHCDPAKDSSGWPWVCNAYRKINYVSGYERAGHCHAIRGNDPTCEKFKKKKGKAK